jgi:hypothetical protein
LASSEDDHQELTRLGTAIKAAWWRYGHRIGCLGVVVIAVTSVLGTQNWWERLPRPWDTVAGWACLVIFCACATVVVRSRPGRQPCRYCNAPYRKISILDSTRVGSRDQVLMKCEACGKSWLWEDSPF